MDMDLRDIRNQWEKSKERRERAHLRRCMYQHDWKDQLREEVLRQFLPQNAEKLMVRADTNLNLLRWATDLIAAIYSRPVVRTFGETLLAPMPEVDMAIDLACRLTFLQGETLLRPMWVNGRMMLDVIPSDRFHVVPDPVDRLRLQAVVISHCDHDGQVKKYELWTDATHAFLGRDWKYLSSPTPATDGTEFANPYGIIPYVCAHSLYPTASFWHHHEAEGLYQATLLMGVALTDWGHLRHLQSFKQLVIRTEEKDGSKIAKIAADPSSTLMLRGPTASASVLDMQADLSGHLNALFDRAEAILHLYGITADVVRGNAQLSASSGYALQLKLHSMERIWEGQRIGWRLWERELWRVARVVLPIEGGPTLPDDALDIAWGEIGPGRDPVQTQEQARLMLSAGMISKRESLRLVGYTEEQIEQIIAEQLDEMEMFAPPSLPGEGGV